MTDTPTIYSAHDVPDLLNALPTLFGFRLTESLVAVATRGPRRRFGFRLRVDIPPVQHVEELAELTVAHLRNHGAEGAVLIAVTAQQDVAGELLSAIERHLDDIELVVAVRSDGSRYWVNSPDFPVDGITYETSDHHLSIVQAVAAGQQILPSREALVARFAPVQEPRRTWLRHATRAVLPQIDSEVAGSHESSVVELALANVRPILDRGLAGKSLTDDELVRLCVWVHSMVVRDAVLGLINRDNAHDMLRVFTLLAQNAVPPCEVGVLDLAGFAAWLTGDGAQAVIAAERALEVDPTDSMAQTLLETLERGISPDRWFAFAAEDTSAP